MVNSVINQVFYDRCDIVEVNSTHSIDIVGSGDYEKEYRTGCFGVKPNEEEKEVYASVIKSSPCFSIKPQAFEKDQHQMSFEYPKREINTTTDHLKKAKAPVADDSMSLRFEIENFLV